MQIVSARTGTAAPSTERTRPSRTIETAWAATTAASVWTAPSSRRDRSDPSASYARSAKASAAVCRPARRAPRRQATTPPARRARATTTRAPRPERSSPASCRIARRRVVESAVRLDVAERERRHPQQTPRPRRPGRRSTPPARPEPCRDPAARTRRDPDSRGGRRPRRRGRRPRRTVRSIVSGSPAWAPQATLTLVTSGMSVASSPIGQGPTPSPTSALRSTRTWVPPGRGSGRRRRGCVDGRRRLGCRFRRRLGCRFRRWLGRGFRRWFGRRFGGRLDRLRRRRSMPAGRESPRCRSPPGPGSGSRTMGSRRSRPGVGNGMHVGDGAMPLQPKPSTMPHELP